MVLTNDKITDLDKILLFICGDSKKNDLRNSIINNVVIKDKKKIPLILKDQKNRYSKKDKNNKEIIDKSYKYPYPIPAKFITKAFLFKHDSTAGTNLRKLKKQGFLVQKGKYWQLDTSDKSFNKLIQRMNQNGLIGELLKTELITDFVLPDLSNRIIELFNHIKPLQKEISKEDFTVHNFNETMRVQQSPSLFNALIKGISNEDIKHIMEYTLKVYFFKQNRYNPKTRKFESIEHYYFRELAYALVSHYYLTRDMDESKVGNKSLINMLILQKMEIMRLIDIIDAKNKHNKC